MIYQSDRVFKLWDYTVGHAQLLLRSPASAEMPDNIDIVFLGVQRLDIPTRMAGLALDGPKPVDRPGSRSRDLYRITSGGEEYFVIAAAFRIYKNQHDLRESSLEYFSPEPGKDPGEVLLHTGLLLASPQAAGQVSP